MKSRKPLSSAFAAVIVILSCAADAGTSTNLLSQKQGTNAPWSDPHFFPLAVWLQSPANAKRYRDAGINTYVGLWKGPTEPQLTALKEAGLRVVCAQNEVGLQHLADTNIIAWMHGDEPDNAQSIGARFGFSAPIAPAEVVKDYHRIRAADPSRPVLLNLGQGVAWDGWYGRGSRTRHPEDYPEYLKGCDIASFDIYPVNHDSREVAGKLWLVAHGVQRLAEWSGSNKIVWNCLETTAIEKPGRKPTPQQVRAEAWMSIIHGSRGLIYFVHQFKPKFREAAVFDDAEMLSAVTALNRQITELAPVLNSPALSGLATVQSEKPEVSIAFMTRRHEGATYLFAVSMRGEATVATFTLKDTTTGNTAEVLDEKRSVPVKAASFADRFQPWEAHLYRLHP